VITPLLFLAAILAAPKPADVAKPAAAADGWDKAFEISKVEVPAGIDDQVGGLAFLDDGRLAVAFTAARSSFAKPTAPGSSSPKGSTNRSASYPMVKDRCS